VQEERANCRGDRLDSELSDRGELILIRINICFGWAIAAAFIVAGQTSASRCIDDYSGDGPDRG